MTARLDWIEKAGIENMKLHYVCANTLARAASTTFVILLIGMGASLGYAICWLAPGAAALTLWLLALLGYLTVTCCVTSPIPAIYNEPRNLNRTDMSFEALRYAELLNLQARIDMAAQRNAATARHLNRVHRLALGSLLGFVSTTLVTRRMVA